MNSTTYRALVVDDELAMRDLAVRALIQEGLECDVAADGAEALERISQAAYDVVVTDLRMPKRHGHALAVDLLTREPRPVLVVLTGVIEPRLAKDLLARGVDDIQFKPVNYRLFAIRVRSLLERRRQEAEELLARQQEKPPGIVGAEEMIDVPRLRPSIVSSTDLDITLSRLREIPPLSRAALEAAQMAESEEYNGSQLAAAIERGPSLTVDVLKMANSPRFNPSQQPVASVEQAVARIGHQEVAQLALASDAMASTMAARLSWLDTDLTWKRSVASGVAVELLAAQAGLNDGDRELFVAAVAHVLGRVVLGTLYPDEYRQMLRCCEKQGTTLANEETRMFPFPHGEVMARLLSAWNLPAGVCDPLRHLGQSYTALGRLTEPLRTKTELLKLAVFVGRLAVGHWMPWDRVELPTAEVLGRLNASAVADLVERTRADLHEIVAFRILPDVAATTLDSDSLPTADRRVLYAKLSPTTWDAVPLLLRSLGIETQAVKLSQLEEDTPVVVNATGMPVEQLRQMLPPPSAPRVVIADAGTPAELGSLGRPVILPGSFFKLSDACLSVATPRDGNVGIHPLRMETGCSVG